MVREWDDAAGEVLLLRVRPAAFTELFNELNADETERPPRPFPSRISGVGIRALLDNVGRTSVDGGGGVKNRSGSERGVEAALWLNTLLSIRSPLLSTNGFPSLPRTTYSFVGIR